MSRCDVLVIGGGMAGVACARTLQAGGVDVIVVTEGAPTWGRGHLMVGTAEHPHRLLEALGPERAREYLELGRSGARIARELGVVLQEGGLRVGLKDEAREIGPAVAASEALGLPSERWSAEQVAERTGLAALGPARFVPDDALVDRELLHRSLSEGLTVVAGRVEGLEGETAVLATRRIEAEVVVLAGGWGCRHLDSFFADTLIPVRHQGVVMEARPLTWPISAQYGYLGAADIGDRLLVTGARWATPHLEVWETQPAPIDAVHDKLVAWTQKLWSSAPAPLERWAGIVTHTCDNLPLLGPIPGDMRRIACTGFTDQGLAAALGGGVRVAQGLLGEAGPPEMLRPSRLVGV